MVMRRTKTKTKKTEVLPAGLPKCPTGIHGLDEITLGGLPRGRPTLVCGSAGCGKTLLGMEFLVRGAVEFGEPGVCLSFEETAEAIVRAGSDEQRGVGKAVLVNWEIEPLSP